ncbi:MULTISPECIES: sensor histidine kinase [unclassified Crossiella]|uniref:sensor histidine kinase n=1 Tax=unclassified Crossiella TaxID=2620835 RepID=UPI002000302B|nr:MULTISPECIES: sensor histidine kinase [unclassified Crossiella]MCK2244275.1 sensor histidine kinase [Crossiella sp. S99.2]MCK2257897.1 sensor histidine kinase [Crossiella sp. S99.1]
MGTRPVTDRLHGQLPPVAMLPWLASLLLPALRADALGATALGAFALTYGIAVYLVLNQRGPSWAPIALAVLLTTIAVTCAREFGDFWYLPMPFVFAVWSLITVDYGAPLVNVVGVLVVHLLGVWVGSDAPPIVIGAFLTFLAGMLTFVVLRLSRAVAELEAAREELAHTAVGQERLRFARDLHDLLGHTLSLVVVKAEAVRRLIPRDPGKAQEQAADIEAVGRRALTEVRQAVSGYREPSLNEELAGARAALVAAGVTAELPEPGELPGAVGPVLGWVVREGVTNVLRHARARRCVIELRTADGTAVLTIANDGAPPAQDAVTWGNGLCGLTERVQAAGGELTAIATPGGFMLRVSVPTGETS